MKKPTVYDEYLQDKKKAENCFSPRDLRRCRAYENWQEDEQLVHPGDTIRIGLLETTVTGLTTVAGQLMVSTNYGDFSLSLVKKIVNSPKMTEMRAVNYPGVLNPIYVNADGTQVVYEGSPRNQVFIKSKKRRNGYFIVQIDSVRIYTHKLVALGWVPNPNDYPIAMHNDCITTHNYYKNLSWGTRYKAAQNVKAMGLLQNKGLEYRGTSKIDSSEARSIALRLKSGEIGREIAKEYKVSEMTITRIRKRYLP